MSTLPLLTGALRQPSSMAQLDAPGWELLLRQAVATDMGATLALLAEEHGLLPALPARVQRRLDWERRGWQRHGQAVRFELRQVQHALRITGLPLILLKGTAYVAAGLPAAAGRLFSDVDILVPKDRLNEVEGLLMAHGWASSHHDAYDQRYYREWMHELPPMQHMRRGTAIDVHHAILPETARVRPDPALLRAGARAVPGQPGVYVLAPCDMVMHSAVHLFSEGEYDHGLRDLFDLHRLLCHFGAHEPGFWAALAPRARVLELTRPLFYALRYCAQVFGTPVPPAVMAEAEAGRPTPALLVLMDALFQRALRPMHPSCAGTLTPLAEGMLFIRGNWLRMPPLLLSRHLFRKAFLTSGNVKSGQV